MRLAKLNRNIPFATNKNHLPPFRPFLIPLTLSRHLLTQSPILNSKPKTQSHSLVLLSLYSLLFLCRFVVSLFSFFFSCFVHPSSATASCALHAVVVAAVDSRQQFSIWCNARPAEGVGCERHRLDWTHATAELGSFYVVVSRKPTTTPTTKLTKYPAVIVLVLPVPVCLYVSEMAPCVFMARNYSRVRESSPKSLSG